MIVSIHQPSYFPWLGLIDKISKSDIFIYLNSVQLSDNSYQNRNIFLDNKQKVHMLTIPIQRKDYLQKNISDIKIANLKWKKKHHDFIYFNYKKHPYFESINPYLEEFYKMDIERLDDILYESLNISLKLFGIKTKIIKSSELNIDRELKKEDLVLNILEEVGAKTYLSGVGATSYQNNQNFTNRNIKLTYQQFEHQIYTQYKNSNFISGLSCLDYLFNIGIYK